MAHANTANAQPMPHSKHVTLQDLRELLDEVPDSIEPALSEEEVDEFRSYITSPVPTHYP